VNSAFWPVIDNFERALKFARDATADAKLDKLEALIVTHYGRPLADVRFVAAILSIRCEARYGALPMTPQKHKDETLRTLVDITEAAARQQPSVMLFEDAHWADPTTLEVLDLLIDRVRTVPLLMVLTHRPEFQSRWSQQGHVGALNLSKLTRTQSAAMVSALAGGKALPEALLEQILTRTDGVPLFVEELTKSILEPGELTEAGDRYEYAGSARDVTIPTTLRDSLMARLDRFMPVKEIAQIGAAIGREFSYELIAAVAPMQQAQLEDALARLTESGLAFRRGTPPDAVYTFKHALVQDAAYDSLLKSRRQELHAKIARVIEARFPNMRDTEPEVLAQHHSEAGMLAEALPYWLKAGQLALRRMALTSAIAHLESGLRLIDRLPDSPQRNALELQLRTTASVAWEAFRGWPAPQITEVLLPVLTLAKQSGQPDIIARTLWGLWVNPLTQGRIAESLRWADELVLAAEGSTDEGLSLIAHMSAMVTHFWLGNLVTAKTHGDTILALYDSERHGYIARAMNHDPKTLAGLYASHWLWMLGHPDQAARVAEDRDMHARSVGHPFDRAFALTTGGLVYDYRYDPIMQRALAEEAIDIGREHSMPFFSVILAPIVKGISMVRSSQFEQALELMTGSLALWEGSGAGIGCPYYKSVMAEAHARLGQLSSAIEIVDAMLAQISRTGWEERCHLAEVLRLKGWMLSLKGDLESAERNFLASLDWARTQQAKSWELRTSISLARLWQSQGKRQEAYELLSPVYGWFTEGFDTRDMQDAKLLLVELE
jgi:tetratricopeptide (TPR) repeat protein